MGLNISTKKILSASNIKKIIQLGISLRDELSNMELGLISDYDNTKTYTRGQAVYYNNYLYKCLYTTTGDFDESKWQLIGDNLSLITKQDIEAMINLSDEDVKTLQSLILDTSIELSHVWSSSKTYGEIQNAIKKGEAFTLEQLAKKTGVTYKVVSGVNEVTSSEYLYLISNGTVYDIYAFIDGDSQKIGDTTIDLSDYAKVSDLDNYYTKSDSDGKFATITTLNGKFDKANINTIISDTPSDEKVLSEKAIKSELDLKANDNEVIKRTNIATTIDRNSTNSQVPSAKSVYDNSLIKGISDGNTQIPSGSDLNDYLTPGVYTCISSSIAEKLLNCPHIVSNFKMIVNQNTSSTTGFFGYQMIVGTASATNNPCVYYRGIGGVDKTKLTYSQWKKVCTTSVADVGKTNITSRVLNATVNAGGGVYYSIKNGICYVQIAGITVSADSSGQKILSNGSIPIMDLNFTNGHYAIASPSATNGLIVFDGSGGATYYGSVMTIYATISYPVKES